MKVTLCTEGGGASGLGQIVRCEALLEAFLARRIDARLLIHAGGPLPPHCDKYQICPWRDQVGAISDAQDIVIIDTYHLSQEQCANLSSCACTTLFIDDNRRIFYSRGYVLNGNIHAAMLNYGSTDTNALLLGPKYALLRATFTAQAQRTLRESIEEVYITTGGQDHLGLMPTLIEVTLRSLPAANLTVVAGPSFLNLGAIRASESARCRVELSPTSERILALMRSADLAVSATGQTLNELACVGTPAIGIPIIENQRLIGEAWERAGFCKLCDPLNEDWPGPLEVAIESFDFNSRRASASAGQRLIDGKGAQRVVDFLLAAHARSAHQ